MTIVRTILTNAVALMILEVDLLILIFLRFITPQAQQSSNPQLKRWVIVQALGSVMIIVKKTQESARDLILKLLDR